MAIAGTPISFGGNSLQTLNIATIGIKHAGMSTKRAQSYALSHANSSRIPFVEYPNKPITITGKIIGSSIADCDAQIDLFNSYLAAQSANLDIGYNTSTRRYIATATNIDVDRPGGLAFANFTVTFTCTQAFGQDVTATTAVSVMGRTAASYSDPYTFLGTAPFQLPIITATYTAVSGATAKTVIIGNNNTGQSISVTRTWAAGDVLQVDSVNSTVTVNGVLVDFTGAFPSFQPGPQSIGYSDGFTSRTFNWSVTYNVYYL